MSDRNDGPRYACPNHCTYRRQPVALYWVEDQWICPSCGDEWSPDLIGKDEVIQGKVAPTHFRA